MKLFFQKKHLRWLDFSATERRGIHLLLIMLAFLIVIHRSMPYWILSQRDPVAMDEDVRLWLSTQPDSTGGGLPRKNEGRGQTAELFPFDPNTCDDAAFRKLGLEEKQIRNIRNYLNRFRSFRSAEDFAKLYTLSKEDVDRLMPYVVLEKKHTVIPGELYNRQEPPALDSSARAQQPEEQLVPRQEYHPYKRSFQTEKFPIELNAADTTDLLSLPGIGPAFARRIVKYRDKLGGFYSIDQLYEVYKLPPETIASIRDKIRIDQQLIRTRNLNVISEEDFKQFPMLKHHQVRAIIAYREKHGPFQSMEDVMKTKVVEEAILEVMKWYFHV